MNASGTRKKTTSQHHAGQDQQGVAQPVAVPGPKPARPGAVARVGRHEARLIREKIG